MDMDDEWTCGECKTTLTKHFASEVVKCCPICGHFRPTPLREVLTSAIDRMAAAELLGDRIGRLPGGSWHDVVDIVLDDSPLKIKRTP
jgi:hypothetical protein